MPADSDLFVCREHDSPLQIDGDDLYCPKCRTKAHLTDGVFSFLFQSNDFYEGRYNGRTKYIPRDSSYLATLPLRIVHQGYPTSVAAHLPAGLAILDIGSAGGFDWFAQRYRMIGLDLSLRALRDVATRYAVAVQANALEMPLAPESVDGVISSCVFEHFTPPDKDILLRECRRVLRPNGKIIFFYDIQTDNPLVAAFRKRSPEDYQARFLDGDGHVGYESIDANRDHFYRAGFEVIDEAFHERTPVLSNSSWQKFAEWPGAYGAVGRVGRFATSGLFRLPALAALALADATIGKAMPQSHARCMTSIAIKK